MKISSINSINSYQRTYNKTQETHNNPISKEIQQSANNINAVYNITFCGLFNRKNKTNQVDATNLWSSIQMEPDKTYLINSTSKFELGNSGYILDLGSRQIQPLIHNLQKGQEITIGREHFGPDIQDKTIPIETAKLMLDCQKMGTAINRMDTTVSRKHLKIFRNKSGQLLAQDLNSTNGTRICQNLCKPDYHSPRFKLEPGVKYLLPYKSIISVANEMHILNDYKERFRKMKTGDAIIIGSDKSADILSFKDTVSRFHAKLTKQDEGLYIEDLHSTNGTYFLGTLKHYTDDYSNITEETVLKKNVPTKVPSDCQLYIGNDLTMDFRNKNILNKLNKHGKITVGRSCDCDFVVPEFYHQVSRKHLLIEKDDDDIIITDLSSTNGTTIVPKNKIRPFYGSIENLCLMQGNIGDCYLLSTLYALSRNYKGQELLRNMVKVDEDGNYLVKFFDAPEIKVLPDELDGQENKKGAAKISVFGDLGIKAIERAYGKLLKSDSWFSRGCMTLYGPIDDGGFTDNALYRLTGIRSKEYRPKNKNFENILTNIYNSGIYNHILTCTTPNKGNFGDYMDKNKFFVTNHVYAVKYIDPFSKSIGIVNPHNTRNVYNINWEDFKNYFDYFYDALV